MTGFCLTLAFDEVEDGGGVAPSLPHPDLQVEINIGIQDLLDLAPSLNPDLLDQPAVPPDDDAPLTVLLDEDAGADIGDLSSFFFFAILGVLPLLHRVDEHRRDERHLLL